MEAEVKVTCYCGSDQSFERCCNPYLTAAQHPSSPEQLMRSRYTAYVLADADYIVKTTHPKTRYLYKKRDILAWSKESDWVALEVIEASDRQVIFKAHYRDKSGLLHTHFEKSTFDQVNGIWFYLTGDFE